MTEILWVVKGHSSVVRAEHGLYGFAFGFARSIRREYASLKFMVLQLGDGEHYARSDNTKVVFQHCFIDNSRNDKIDMDFKASVNMLQFLRLVRHSRVLNSIWHKESHVETEERLFCAEGKLFQLDMARAGGLNSMTFNQPTWASDRPPLADDQDMVEIKATGLQFKNVLVALGFLPWQELGRECSGVVIEVGRELRLQHKVGQKVLH
jgi:hypothetical protein